MAQIEIQNLADMPALPLTLYTSSCIAEMIIAPFGASDIVVGLTRDMVDKLILRTQDKTDTELALTRDAKRFVNHESYSSWFRTERIPFALIHRATSELMALAWMGEAPIEKGAADHGVHNMGVKLVTVAYRSYPPYRGNGFMTSFMEYVLTQYKKDQPKSTFWVSIDPQNVPSLSFAKKLGFTKTFETSGHLTRVILTM